MEDMRRSLKMNWISELTRELKVDRIDVEKLVTHLDKIYGGIWFSGEVRAVLVVVIDRGQKFTERESFGVCFKDWRRYMPFLQSRGALLSRGYNCHFQAMTKLV